jgi:hypothetical protein
MLCNMSPGAVSLLVCSVAGPGGGGRGGLLYCLTSGRLYSAVHC